MIIPIPSINQLYISSLLAFTAPKNFICLMTPVFSTYHSLAKLHNRAIIPTEMNILNGRYMINWKDL
jgi:bifunctional pyridoxal-dependent enzyme with beta-cystathionase and maltose regulon repressor activities